MKRLLIILFCLSLISSVLYAENNNTEPRIALVLSGGIVSRGLSEIGVIKALEEENIPISYVAGTSMGAVLGSLLAQGYSAEEIKLIAGSINWTEAFAQMQDYKNLLFGQKETWGKYLISLDLDGIKPIVPNSLVSPHKPSLLFTEISIKALSITDFNDFKIPFRANATDIETGKEVIFFSGYLPRVLRASSAVPVMMAPVEISGKLLVDGGAVNNLPVNLVEEFDPDIIVAVNLGVGLKKKKQLKSFLSILSQSLALPQEVMVKKHKELADVVIEPDISKYGFSDFGKIDEIIEVGYQAAKAKIPEIKRLIKEKGKRIAIKDDIDERDGVEIKKILIVGNTVYSTDELLRLIGEDHEQIFDHKKIEKEKKQIWRKYFIDGYRLAEIKTSFSKKRGELIFRIDEGHIENTEITGREHISEVFLKSRIHSHEIFNSKRVMDNIDRLFATGYFESVNFSVIPGKNGWILKYLLKEKQRNSLAVGLRYDTYQQLSLLSDLTLKFFKSQNFTETLSLKVGNEFKIRSISRFWPRRFGNNLVGEVMVYFDKKAQEVFENNQVVSSFYYLPKGIRGAAKANLEPLGQLSVGGEITHVSYENIFSIFPDENVTKLFVNMKMDFLDNPVSPRSGFKLEGEYQQAIKMFWGEYDFSKVIGTAAFYFPLHNKHIIFTKGHLQLGRGIFPLSERYRVGGEKNLFGYGRTQYLGKDAATLRLGYKFPLFLSDISFLESIYLSAIQDFGIVANSIDEMNAGNIMSGFGLELEAVTVLGVNSKFSLGMGQRPYLYFSIGNEF
jgi:predicted acylesterase/phospholipase RssA/hemolysin activation/secretion protein